MFQKSNRILGDYGYGSGGVLAPAAAVGDVSGVRRVLRNGTLLFPPFPPAAFRHDVHGAVYRCLASNAAGRVLSRDSHVRAGERQPSLPRNPL
ncbi:hypothetical protein J437_LFUL009999 [Ladona fulva]|uniref:Down syndrome cell adhesion molecule-like protein Dscam2 n=1 Tax=Ladona fulva TaxID=123851 RepID=A0A8K0K8X3_LADFU|nr:hypothetical protein J437_LFUL009999 [Ladona fulva]